MLSILQVVQDHGKECIMNFWKVLMESITAKQQRDQHVRKTTQWFDVSEDTSKVVVPMSNPSQIEKDASVHEQATVSTMTGLSISQEISDTSSEVTVVNDYGKLST